MDKKRVKRSNADGMWDCSVCTYKNSAEAFKCAMCDVRKGTSTRKPKPNPELVAQQVAQQLAPPPVKREKPVPSRRSERAEVPSAETDTSQDSHRSESSEQQHRKRPTNESRKLKNLDRRSAVSMEITVNGVTVVVTDFKPKPSTSAKPQMPQVNTSNDSRLSTSSPGIPMHTSHNSSDTSISPGGAASDRTEPD